LLLSVFGPSKIRQLQWQLTGSVFVMVVFGGLLALATFERKGIIWNAFAPWDYRPALAPIKWQPAPAPNKAVHY